MALYEHIVLVRQDATPAQVDTLVEQMKATIEGLGGKVSKVESWGLRSLAYRMKKNRKAHYALLNIEGPWAALAEMERLLKLNEDVLRYITVRVEEHEEGPSAVLLRRERDERRGERDDRGDRGDFRGGDRGDFRGGDRDRGDRGDRRPPPRRRDEENIMSDMPVGG